ncbi:MAG: class I SAM-dependent methyltransferase [Candidatus Aenigmarchaeota archaeon]|nr:class I SAM-dependent methyltransferase [Candidatus Aenigmarchaeota archaeon]
MDIEQEILRIATTLTPTVFLNSKIAWHEYVRTVKDAAKEIPRNANVLDIGCGCGYSTAYLCALRKDITIIGADPWPHFKAWNALTKLVNKNSFFLSGKSHDTNNSFLSEKSCDRCRFVKASGLKLPFKSGEFDAVVSFGVIEHTADDNVFLGELNRVLKKGGKNIIFHLPNKFSFNEALAKAVGKDAHVVKYSIDDVRAIMKTQGFRVLKIEREYFLPLQIYKVSNRIGGFFDSHYKGFHTLDKFLMNMPFKYLCQSFKVVSVKA